MQNFEKKIFYLVFQKKYLPLQFQITGNFWSNVRRKDMLE